MHIYVLFNLLMVNFRNAYLDSFSIFSKTVRRIPSKKYFCNTHVIVYLILEYQANQIGRCIFEHLFPFNNPIKSVDYRNFTVVQAKMK